MNKSRKQIAVLSIKTLKARVGLYAKLALSFAVLVFLLCLFSAYMLALTGMQGEGLAEYAASNQIVSTEPISGLPSDTESFVVKRFDATVHDDVEWEPGVPDPRMELTLTVEDTSYDLEMSIYTYKWNFNRIFAADKLVTDNDRQELASMYGVMDALIGRMPKSANEVAVSEVYLEEFGLTGEQVLGKVISIVASSEQDIIEINGLLVCGIINREFSNLSGKYTNRAYNPCLLFSQDNAMFADGERVSNTYVYSLTEWLSEEAIDKLTDRYDCDYLGWEWAYRMTQIATLQIITTKLYVVLGGALCCSVVLMVYLMMDKLITSFNRNCGILLSCGMRLDEAKYLLLAIFGWVCLFAFVIAAVMSVCGILAINAIVSATFGLEIEVTAINALATFGIGLAAVIAIAFIYYLYAASRIKRRTIKDLLNTSVN